MKKQQQKKAPPYQAKKCTEDMQAEIATMADCLRNLRTVPARILNGSHELAVSYKTSLEIALRDSAVTFGLSKTAKRRQVEDVHKRLSAHIELVT